MRRLATTVIGLAVDSTSTRRTLLVRALVPGYGSTAGSREHEDGHALINRSLARRCAGDALHVSVEAGHRGQSLINNMVNHLTASSDPVHARYHQYVAHARYGEHLRYAEQAVAEVMGCPTR